MRERMGSGGPRGLQILRSGASRVRGGFDSHAFPPLLSALALAGLLAFAGGAAAQPAAAPSDSVGAAVPPADSLPPPAEAIQTVPPDTARTTGLPKAKWSDQPRFVMFRSLLVPGWGQFYNRAWFKAAAVAGTEGWFIVALVQDNHALADLEGEIQDAQADFDQARYDDAVNRYNARLDTYVAHQWLFGAVLAYALVDAYVDAHFRNFDLEFRHDPALPDDLPEDPPAPNKGGGSRTGGTRVALRWHF